jgi:hypothetical protein
MKKHISKFSNNPVNFYRKNVWVIDMTSGKVGFGAKFSGHWKVLMCVSEYLIQQYAVLR